MKAEKLTTAAGIPVSDNQNSLTAGERGPTLLQDHFLIDKLAHFNRERIPERVVHAKAAGAHGTFTVTHDITKYTKAKIFSKSGKKTEMVGRFSTVAILLADLIHGHIVDVFLLQKRSIFFGYAIKYICARRRPGRNINLHQVGWVLSDILFKLILKGKDQVLI